MRPRQQRFTKLHMSWSRSNTAAASACVRPQSRERRLLPPTTPKAQLGQCGRQVEERRPQSYSRASSRRHGRPDGRVDLRGQTGSRLRGATDPMNNGLACGSCSRRVSEIRAACLMCGRDSEGVRRDVEQRIEPLLQLHAALLASTHIYASYERSLVENELRGFGTDPCDPPAAPRTVTRKRGR